MNCRICSGSEFSVVVDLKEQPWGNHFLKKEEVGKEKTYPLRLTYCHDCGLAQLDYTVNKEIMFSSHTYLSGITKSLRSHFEQTADFVDKNFCKEKKTKAVLDIGSNDGTQLECYKNLGFDVLGVESSKNIAKIANEKNIPTIDAFFNLELAKKIDKKFDVINASGIFFHLEELHSVTQAIKLFLKDDGVFVVQFIYIKSIMDNVAFDQIYHEHLLYYTLKTLGRLLGMYDLELFDGYLSPIHGGSIIGIVTHKNRRKISSRLKELLKEEEKARTNDFSTYQSFAKGIEKLKNENLKFLHLCKKKNKIVYGMGAPVKGNTLLNYFEVGRDLIPYLVEKNELRKGLFSPGRHIPILIEKELSSPPDVYYVLAWNFKNEILKNNKHLIDKGVEFYFPINIKNEK